MLRWFGPGLTTTVLAALVYFALTGKIDFSALDRFTSGDTVVDVRPVTLDTTARRPADVLRIATFNIQVFGDKKSSTREVPGEGIDVMGTIAKVVTNFDLVAIQEIHNEGLPIRRLVDLINASGGRYAATVSEPIRTEGSNYTECYAYVWDDTRVRLVQNSAYVVHDNYKRMDREPMVASFEARVPPLPGQRPFRFTMINVHTDPDKVSPKDPQNEINVLDDVFVRVRQYEYETAGEEDCLLVGDLNVATSGLQELTLIPNVVSVGGDVKTNTRGTNTYDHILIDQNMTREFLPGRVGVLDFQRDLGLTERQALLVSDHLPLWAEFSAYEVAQAQPVASASTRIMR
jgi:endonuclease/exonuclease/phosphatase family metal-dependent hydrolase